MKKYIIQYSIFLILFIAAALRLWSLGTNPPSLTPDEAALGYNAYSILKTGRDEYGELLPIIFKSFGDFKPGFYIYTAVPAVALFGLTEFAVRLPSAIAGIAAVWLVYRIIIDRQLLMVNGQRLTIKKDQQSTANSPAFKSDSLSAAGGQLLANIAALMFAISPWHIHFSRGAWEVNLALTFTLAGIYFFLKYIGNSFALAIESNKVKGSYQSQASSMMVMWFKGVFVNEKSLYWSAFFFGLTLVTYQGAKLSVLIVLVILGALYFNELKRLVSEAKNRKHILISGIIGLVIALPILLSFNTGQTGRLKVFSVFSYTRPEEYLTKQLELARVEFGSPKYYLYYSETLNTTRGIMGRWFNHFSGKFLFFDGDWSNPRHIAPDTGQMLLADMILLVIGLFAMTKVKSKFGKFILLWLILAPLPAALSRDQVHAVRALNMVVPLTVITSYGIYYLLFVIKKLKYLVRLAVYCLLVAAYIVSLTIYFDNYFIHQPIHNSEYWVYGYKEVVNDITPIKDNFDSIQVAQSYSQPYIYFLFYGGEGSTRGRNVPYDPARYQAKAHLTESEFGDVGTVDSLDNINFAVIDWSRDRGDTRTLFVADPIQIPPQDSSDPNEFNVISEIYYLDEKEIAFRLIEVLDKEDIDN